MNRKRITRFASLAVLAATPAICGDWDQRRAAGYLDSRQQAWSTWKTAASPGGTCFSCHTGMTYLMARPALRASLGESESTPYEKGLLEALRFRAGRADPKEMFHGSATEPRASQQLGVETIFESLFLTADSNRDAALDRLWSLQLKDGDGKGAWAWFSLDLDPFEMPDSRFFGATLGAIASGATDPEYRARPNVQKGIAELTAYLQREQARQPLHNRLMLVWASTKLPGIITDAERREIVKLAAARQQPDGGWTMESLGPWKKRDQAPPSEGSNSYATALTAFTLERAGVAHSNPGLKQALIWLSAHQDRESGSWAASSMNKKYEAGSIPLDFMRDAATGFAVMALLDADVTRASIW